MTWIRAAVLLVALVCSATAPAQELPRWRPPSVPLVACDPYFSIWSPADRATDAATQHWTGRPHRLTSLARIDGHAFRLLGDEPKSLPPLPQRGLTVWPTRSVYELAGSGVEIRMTFLTPAVPDNAAILSWPVTYVTWDVRSTDGRPHEVSLYFDAAGEIAVNEPDQPVTWSTEPVESLAVLRIGSRDQPVLARKGDDLRIDWGYLYVAARRQQASQLVADKADVCREQFSSSGKLPAEGALTPPRAPREGAPVLAMTLSAGRVEKEPVSRWLILAYDDQYSVQYMRQNLRPYWRRHGAEAADLLWYAAHSYPMLRERCAAFDRQLTADAARLGGERYAAICALAYRQCLAAGKICADAQGQPLVFPKENTSNGCIATVDVIYPQAPQFLLCCPSLAKGMLIPILDYAASPRWKFPFAPHDLGTYPHANGQVYGGGERTEENQMPVEESANMLILLAAVAQIDGHAHFAERYWPVVQKWAEYLRAKGFDPENQLCTDDFAGHLAHNVNLSAKAIVALGAYAKLGAMLGKDAEAAAYRQVARDFAARWIREADDGQHFRLALDKPGSWSQKYNLVWDRLLDLNLFPAAVLRKEMDSYRSRINKYGLPLDSRKAYAKTDWTLWTATLTGRADDFQALVDPVFQFLNDTPNRVPLNDWYWTHNAQEVNMHARSVVGGVFLRMLYDRPLAQRWAAGDDTRPGPWAPLPAPPKVTAVVPAADRQAAVWRYTTSKPADGWQSPAFDDAAWQQGPAGFGSRGTPGATVRSNWDGPEIWLRRRFNLPEGSRNDLALWIHHDEDAQVFVNGVPAASVAGFTTDYELAPLSAAARAALRSGENVLAVRCRQTGGGQYIDVGLVRVEP